jgi:hypothetical protein
MSHWPGGRVIIIFPGQLTTGNSLSKTRTVKAQFSVFPRASEAVQVTMFVPLGKLVPEGGLHTSDAVPQLSVAFAT